MGERRLRRERELLVLAAQHTEQRPDLAERLAPGSSTAPNAQLGVVGLRAREPLGGRRLGDHRLQRVADQVVELARDPGALGDDRAGGAGVAVVLSGRRLPGSAWLSCERARTSRPSRIGPPTTIVGAKKKSPGRPADGRAGS